MKILCNSVLHNFFYPKLDTSPFDSIWLEISLSWHTKSQGPKKKCTHFTIERIHSWLADTARNQGSFTTFALWSVKSFNSPTVYPKKSVISNIITPSIQIFNQKFPWTQRLEHLKPWLRYKNQGIFSYALNS